MKSFNHYLLLLICAVLLGACTQKSEYNVKTATDSNGYTYEYVTNDATQSRVYTLDNGLTVYLSKNDVEPRLSTLIGVKAGSTSENPDATGLAHYFEHMMFKGTSHLGTQDWEKENAVLAQISDLFEQRRNSTDPEEQKALYKRIDSLSVIASTYAIPSEYDKLLASLGASSTNAGTSYDMTVFINEIPSNELEKWIKVEADRFQNIVLRLFHTELETVYEEFNMYQDRDGSRFNQAIFKALFPNHPYGREVIGLPEHIKFPSMKEIVKFHDTYYVPNNMAIALSGDLDFDNTIKLIDTYFGGMEKKELPERAAVVEAPITEPITVEVLGPESEEVCIAYRFETNDETELMMEAVNNILSNDKCGLVDIDLNQQQKVLNAGAFNYSLNDYSLHILSAEPREGQTLEEARDLLFQEIEKIKNGEFEDWVLEASINNLRLRRVRQNEYNMARTNNFMSAFIANKDYVDLLKYDENLAKITKKQVVEFAKNNYLNNYVVAYKRIGDAPDLVHVEKPDISSITINRDVQSEYFKEISDMPSEEIKPVFVDYKDAIKKENIQKGLDFYYIKNVTNGIFTLYYMVEAGSTASLRLPLALDYIKFLGTDEYTPAELQQEMYKLALSFGVRAGKDMSYIYISGLEDKYDEAIKLVEHIMNNVKPDQEVYDNYISGILKKRDNAKLDPSTILWDAMRSFGTYGIDNPTNNILSEAELKAIDPKELTDIVKNMSDYEHIVFYYGPDDMEKAIATVKEYHKVEGDLKPVPEAKKYVKQDVTENKVYIVDYKMVQTNLLMVSRGDMYNVADEPYLDVFGEYYGGGLSSIIFQEIRESRSLAYSSMAAISKASKAGEYNSVLCFLGTQTDKLKTATDAFYSLMNEMPKAEKQFELSKDAIIKKINTERIVKDQIFFSWYDLNKYGIDYDIRKPVYEKVQNMTIDDFENYFNNHVAGKKYNYLLLADLDKLNMKQLKAIGEVEVLDLDKLFGY